ncbi:pyridoxal phosphate-dependent decarboxylase family protein [Planktotalea arctica]|uniref:pyridoxal phosphate-dependent decarboxylase family protein n=1 Tax=Planktotalea arctica TaxID=1481893 RepID=UPI000A175BEC|nr:pyridoxal-dependent decarboxylase [Planktotalea arctica]
MQWDEFEGWSKQMATWAADYHRTLRDRPVRAQVAPGDTLALLPGSAPNCAEPMDTIIADFERIVMPGITHWQHPRFFAYFPSNAAPPSILAEQIVSAISAQCMLWQTSPSATELETRMMEWICEGLGLPDDFTGVIQDSASSATLAAVLNMRERALDWQGNQTGLTGHKALRIYCSDQVHSSIDRAIWVAGIGQNNLVKLPTKGPRKSIDIEALNMAITKDRAEGYLPAGIVAVTGATGMGACDDIMAITQVAMDEGLFTHLDAAWAGSAMFCPEFREIWAGAERCDSIVFNPHKWLGAQFDCSVQFLRNPDALRQTLAIRPEYLKTHTQTEVTDYSEWSLPLGRRFRALKLWFLMRAYGLDGLRARMRNHVAWAEALAKRIGAEDDFEIVTDPIFSLFTFRYLKGDDLDDLNQRLVDRLNDDGRIYLTQTFVDDQKVIRFQIGQFDCTEEDVNFAFDTICEIARSL